MKKVKCESCEYKGYSAEICRYHSLRGGSCSEEDFTSRPAFMRIGKVVALGAGAGLAATFTGMVVAPIIGLKAALGHAIAAKITVGGGVAGAGVNVARKMKKTESGTKPARKRPILLPTYLKG